MPKCWGQRWSCSVFGFVPSTQRSVLGLPTSTCLADASVLDATIATAPPAGFSHSWGHRMAASPGQDFPLLGVKDRRKLEAVYRLLIWSREKKDGVGREGVLVGLQKRSSEIMTHNIFLVNFMKHSLKMKKIGGALGPRAPPPNFLHF